MKALPPRVSQWLLWMGLPVFNTLNQVAMKLSAHVLEHQAFGVGWLLEAMRCPTIWLCIMCEIVNFALWLAILKRHSLAQAFPLTAISYAALMLVSWTVFHESVFLRQVLGTVIIMIGIAVLGFQGKS